MTVFINLMTVESKTKTRNVLQINEKSFLKQIGCSPFGKRDLKVSTLIEIKKL